MLRPKHVAPDGQQKLGACSLWRVNLLWVRRVAMGQVEKMLKTKDTNSEYLY